MLVFPVVFAPRGAAGADAGPVWLVVTRPMFVDAVKPLAARRRKGGFEVVVSTQPVSKAISALKRRPAFVLLIGDDQPGQEKQPWYVPSPRRKFYRWRAAQRKAFASDALIGDLDGDLIPDVPVGRIPVRTARQLATVVTKIIAFESRPPSPDDLRLPVWAGSPCFNPVIDCLATGLLLAVARTNGPAWAGLWVISSDPAQAFCGWPPDQPAMFTKQLKRGGVMAVLVGHASTSAFYSMQFKGRHIEYAADPALADGKPAPATVIIACDAGDFTGRDNCLAESLLLLPGGPVAVIGATTESHPLTNYFSGLCLMQALGGTDKRIGSLWLNAQRRAIMTRNPFVERLLRGVEGKLGKEVELEKLRRDHILMYALLGDPATVLPLPDRLTVNIDRRGDVWHWKVRKPKGATRLYVGFRPDRQNLPAVGGRFDKTGARGRFHRANATFAFKPAGELPADKAWKGTINKSGILRLVAVGPKRLCVATFVLKFDEE